MKKLNTKVKFNPFDGNRRMNWNLWLGGRQESDFNHMPKEGRICLMLDRKTGNMYMKKAESVEIMEWVQGAGFDAVVAVAHEKECFD